jgi:hypothetical protein
LDFFFGGFLASRFGAFLFPMPTASHRFEDDARGPQLKRHFDPHFFPYPESAIWTVAAKKCFASAVLSLRAADGRE